MQFPAELKIGIFDQYAKSGVARIATKLTLFAQHKNNYVIPMVTNSVGEIRISLDHVRQSIKDDWELFPMDYSTPLEECSADVEFKVCSTEDVVRTIEAMRIFSSASTITDELIQGFESCINSQYLPTAKLFDVEENNFLSINIVPTRGEE